MRIPFNKPYLTKRAVDYINQAVVGGHISGNGHFTGECHRFFEERYGFAKCLLTTSCTDALEMCALLIDIQPGDEVIVPSYTFVSSALAFVRQGAKIVFADSRADHPGIDEDQIESLITPCTKAIVPVHYAGFACDMDKIMAVADRHKLWVIEDAAQATNSYYKGRPLGGIGHFGCFSFHETKNVQCGEGGMLAINDSRFGRRAEILWEKGTNRAAFFRGEVNKYGWVDVGSSFLLSDLLAAALWGQLEALDAIQNRRLAIWRRYYDLLKPLDQAGVLRLPVIPEYATNNAHMFYCLATSLEERTGLLAYLKSKSILAVFHYRPLHDSPYYRGRYQGPPLPNAGRYDRTLFRLPMYYELGDQDVERVVAEIKSYFYPAEESGRMGGI